MRWRRGPSEPVPPQGVRYERVDGTVLPLEVVYDGLRDGVHVWRATGRIAPGLGHVHIEVLPPRTEVVVEIALDTER